jgi:hypothetical protein
MHRILRSALVVPLLFAAAMFRTAAAAPADSIISGICEGSVLPIGVVVPPEGFEAGCLRTYILKHGNQGGDRGRYGFVDLPPCPAGPCANPGGQDRFSCELLHGNFCCTNQLVGREVETVAGNRAGPFLDALSQRFWSDTDHSPGCHVEYTGNGARVLRIVALTPTGPGSKVHTVAGFVRFFMRERPDKASEDLIGEFIPTSGAPE